MYLQDQRVERGTLLWNVLDDWIGRAFWAAGAGILTLLLFAWAARLLPGGRRAAEESPMLPWQRPPGARPAVSVLALGVILFSLLFGAVAGVDTYRGIRAVSGDGYQFTMGEDAHVVERTRGSRGSPNTCVLGPFGRVILEGGDGADGEEYGVYRS